MTSSARPGDGEPNITLERGNDQPDPLAAPDDVGHVRRDQTRATIDVLLDAAEHSTGPYRAIAARRQDVVSALAECQDSNVYMVRIWATAPPADWNFWRSHLLGDKSEPVDLAVIDKVIHRIFDEFFTLSPEDQERVLQQLVTLSSLRRKHAPDAEADRNLLEAVQEKLVSQRWWDDLESIGNQDRLHAAARQLGVGVRTLKQDVDRSLADDVRRPLPELPGHPGTTDAIIDMAKRLPFAALVSISESLPEIDFVEATDRSAGALQVRIELGRIVKGRGSPRFRDESLQVSAQTVARAVEHPAADEAVGRWLGLDPSAAAVRRVLRGARDRAPLPDAVATGLEEWSDGVSLATRTGLVRELITWEQDTADWIGAIATAEITETTPLNDIRRQMPGARNQAARLRLARKAAAIRPETDVGRKKLVDLIVWLLGHTRPKADIAVAVMATTGIVADDGASKRLGKAFERACRRHGRRLTKDEARAVGASGIDLPSEITPKKVRNEVKSQAGRVRRGLERFGLKIRL